MMKTEKDMREIFGKDIQISDVVEARVQETYKQLGAGASRRKAGRISGRKGSLKHIAAAIAVVCLMVPGVVYASSKTEFFKSMFGNGARESNDVIRREIDDGKEGTVEVTIPSKEYVPVDAEQAESMLGKYVMDTPLVKKIGSHTLTVDSFIYDRNGALMYFTLEREGGVTAFRGDEETNLTKGATFTDEADFFFRCETKNGAFGGENTYVDTKKSTADRLYCYSYILWSETLKDGDVPQLSIDTYPCTRKELTEETKITTEKVRLTDKEPVPVRKLDLGKKGYAEYSPLTLSVDMAKGMGLSKEEAEDPYHMRYMEIVYKDGSTYVICDKDGNAENSSYQLGCGTCYKTVFNRLVDVDKIAKIKANEVAFAVK